jgi:hypothetical protein
MGFERVRVRAAEGQEQLRESTSCAASSPPSSGFRAMRYRADEKDDALDAGDHGPQPCRHLPHRRRRPALERGTRLRAPSPPAAAPPAREAPRLERPFLWEMVGAVVQGMGRAYPGSRSSTSGSPRVVRTPTRGALRGHQLEPGSRPTPPAEKSSKARAAGSAHLAGCRRLPPLRHARASRST